MLNFCLILMEWDGLVIFECEVFEVFFELVVDFCWFVVFVGVLWFVMVVVDYLCFVVGDD